MSGKTERELERWKDLSTDELFELLQEHYVLTGIRDWVTLSEEARRLMNKYFLEELEDQKEGIEKDSALGAFISAIALAGAMGAFKAVADAIDEDPDYLMIAVDNWYKENGSYPPSIGAKGLMKLFEVWK